MLFLVCMEALRLGTMGTHECKTFLRVLGPKLGGRGEKKGGKVGLMMLFM